MAHLTIYQSEILFLRTQILIRYCKTVNYDFQNYCQRLTGTLKYYEHICEVMQYEVGQYEKVQRYLGIIQNSLLQNSLKKQLGLTETEQKSFLKNQVNNLSASVLRKLIFEGLNESSQGYKESFVQTCYLYVENERSELLSNESKPGKSGDTIPPSGYSQKSASSGTIPVFKKEPSFFLTPLKPDEDTVPKGKVALSFEGTKTQLNRDNLDKSNQTITSKIQAEIRLEDGEWILVNGSQLRTTFIQVNEPVKLKKGDIIVFGNQRFLFDE